MQWLLKHIVRKTEPSKAQMLALVQQAIKQSEGYGQKDRRFIEERLSIPLHLFTDYNSYMEAGTEKVWAAFRACHVTASRLTSAKFKVESESGAEVRSPELETFLRSPNPFQTWDELLYMTTCHLKLTGNAYWVKDQINLNNRPLYLYPLLPQCVEPIPDEQKLVSEYRYKVNGKEIRFPAEEVIHFKRPHPSRFIVGMGDIEPAEPLFNDFINRDSLEQKFLEKGATPSAIMSREDADDMDPNEWGKLKKKFEDEYGGTKNAGKIAFIGGKWTYSRMGLTHNEMQSLERSKMTVEQIFCTMGVPLSVAGVSSAANYATARLEEKNFRAYEVVPLLDLMMGKLNADGALVKLYNPQWKLVYELSGLVDVEQVWKDYGQFFLQGGVSINEMRQLMGLKEIKGDPLMDGHYVSQGRIPLEMAGLAEAPDPDADPNAPDDEPEDEPDNRTDGRPAGGDED